jgi:hypothetical protein
MSDTLVDRLKWLAELCRETLCFEGETVALNAATSLTAKDSRIAELEREVAELEKTKTHLQEKMRGYQDLKLAAEARAHNAELERDAFKVCLDAIAEVVGIEHPYGDLAGVVKARVQAAAEEMRELCAVESDKHADLADAMKDKYTGRMARSISQSIRALPLPESATHAPTLTAEASGQHAAEASVALGAADRLLDLEADHKAMREDAERYRWWRDHGPLCGSSVANANCKYRLSRFSMKSLDDQTDEALASLKVKP